MKLAIIGPAFFGYLERLAGLFAARGLPATFFDERFVNRAVGKLFLRFAPKALRDQGARPHLEAICTAILGGGYTHVLIVSPEVVTPWLVQRLRLAGLRIVRYGWDSVRNKPRMAALDSLMDEIASFDPDDCAQFGYQLVPLYSDALPSGPDPVRGTDIFYCATVHSSRPARVRDLMRVCAKRGWSHDLMLYYHGRLLWLIRYGWNHSLWQVFPLVSSTPFDRATLVWATRTARIVLDLHHTGQTGLTMRTFEALSLGALVLSTNARGAATLPESLRRRVVLITDGGLESAIEAAFVCLPLPPLSESERYQLSVTRFVDQLYALVTGLADVPKLGIS